MQNYSNADFILEHKHFFIALICCMCISVFWGHEHLTNRSISKCHPKSNITTRVEKSSTSRAFHVHDTGFYWSSENALVFESERKHYSSSFRVEKTLVFEYKFSFRDIDIFSYLALVLLCSSLFLSACCCKLASSWRDCSFSSEKQITEPNDVNKHYLSNTFLFAMLHVNLNSLPLEHHTIGRKWCRFLNLQSKSVGVTQIHSHIHVCVYT